MDTSSSSSKRASDATLAKSPTKASTSKSAPPKREKIRRRETPYTDPKKQRKHYRSKLDPIIKRLDWASGVNGSNFAILFIDAKGRKDYFASDLFRSKLPEWFHDGVIQDARDMAVASQNSGKSKSVEVVSKPKGGFDPLVEESNQGSVQDTEPNAPTELQLFHPATFIPTSQPPVSGSFAFDSSRPTTSSESIASSDSSTSFLNWSAQPFNPMQTHCYRAPSPKRGVSPSRIFPTRSLSGSIVYAPYLDQTSLCSGGTTASTASPLPVPLPVTQQPRIVTFESEGSVVQFLTNRFSEMLQKDCKKIAKIWIPVVHPKKQVRHPYLGGTATKPEWWPEFLRHKEPDHLKKDERIGLLIHILRSGLVPVRQLESKSRGEHAIKQIEVNNIRVMSDIFKVAEGEEKMRQESPGGFQPFTVELACHSFDPQPLAEDDVPLSSLLQGRRKSARISSAPSGAYSNNSQLHQSFKCVNEKADGLPQSLSNDFPPAPSSASLDMSFPFSSSSSSSLMNLETPHDQQIFNYQITRESRSGESGPAALPPFSGTSIRTSSFEQDPSMTNFAFPVYQHHHPVPYSIPHQMYETENSGFDLYHQDNSGIDNLIDVDLGGSFLPASTIVSSGLDQYVGYQSSWDNLKLTDWVTTTPVGDPSLSHQEEEEHHLHDVSNLVQVPAPSGTNSINPASLMMMRNCSNASSNFSGEDGSVHQIPPSF